MYNFHVSDDIFGESVPPPIPATDYELRLQQAGWHNPQALKPFSTQDTGHVAGDIQNILVEVVRKELKKHEKKRKKKKKKRGKYKNWKYDSKNYKRKRQRKQYKNYESDYSNLVTKAALVSIESGLPLLFEKIFDADPCRKEGSHSG